MMERVFVALDKIENPDQVLNQAFASAAGQVQVGPYLEELKKIRGIGEMTALEILGKVSLAIIRAEGE